MGDIALANDRTTTFLYIQNQNEEFSQVVLEYAYKLDRYSYCMISDKDRYNIGLWLSLKLHLNDRHEKSPLDYLL